MAPEMSFSYFFNHLYSDPVSIGGLLVFILMLSGFFWGIGLQKFCKALEKVDCTILGVFTIIALFQLQIFWSVKTGASTDASYSFLKMLILAGPVFCIVSCIVNRSLPIPTWKHLFSFLTGFAVSVFLIHLSSRLTTNNLYYDTVTYLSQTIESVNAEQFAHLVYAKGVPIVNVDPLHDFNGYYYFWAMLLRYVTEASKFTYDGFLVSVYIWGGTFLYGMSLGSLMVNSVNVIYKNWKWKGMLFLVLIMAPYYVNYWNTTLAFFGNTMRTVCVGYTILLAYLYFMKKKSRTVFLPLMITHLAALCFSSSGLFLSAMVTAGIFFTMCWKKVTDWKDYAWFIISCFPLFYYAVLVMMFKKSLFFVMTVAAVGITALLIFVAWLIRNHLDVFDKVFGILFPVAAAGLIAISFFNRNGDYSYSFFFASRSLSDMTVNMTNHLSQAELYRNIIFYALAVLTAVCGKKAKWFRFFLLTLVILFANPLVQPAVSGYLTSYVYSRVFDLFNNPFTLCFMIWCADKLLSYASWAALPVAGLVSLYCGNAAIQADLGNNLLNAENIENYDWEQKATEDSLEMYQYIQDNLSDMNDRPYILSQEVGLKGYVPGIAIHFTTTDYRNMLGNPDRDEISKYVTTILNPNRKFGENDEGSGQEEADFSKLSNILSHYQPDYLVISQTMSKWDERGWYENAYEKVVHSGQAELIWNNDTWAILKVNHDWAAPPKNTTRYWVHRIGSENQTAEAEG